MNSINKQVKDAATRNINDTLKLLGSSKSGLTRKQVSLNEAKYGKNIILKSDEESLFRRLKKSFINPFSVVLLTLALITLISDLILKDTKNYPSVLIIFSMLIISGGVRFIQELKSKKVTDELTKLINVKTRVLRDNEVEYLNIEDLVVGDIVLLRANELVPADLRILEANKCFVSDAFITGESVAKEKDSKVLLHLPTSFASFTNTLFLGTNILSGTCKGVVVATGEDTLYGSLSIDTNERKKGFDKGTNSIAWVLIKFMIFLVPLVFIASGLTKGNWLNAFLFSISVAVGLTPELLPMVITACLSKGSFNMLKKQTIVKNVNAMQTFGNMDVLCFDKTGTLTNDTLFLEYYLDILGNESKLTLDLAYLNSYFTSGIKTHLDQAILNITSLTSDKHFTNFVKDYKRLDEKEFDYDSKISSVLLNIAKENIVISKGTPNEIIKHCNRIYYKDQVYLINEDKETNVNEVVLEMEEEGMKVLAIAIKKTSATSLVNESLDDLILVGYISFFDSPKKDAKEAIKKLKELNVKVKVLTGDNLVVAKAICKRLDIDSNSITGSMLDTLSDDKVQILLEDTSIFAELSPKQKARLIKLLKENGHTVGFLGDGMNDLAGIIKADVGISVDTASSTIKQIADVILLKKDLNVLEEGIIEGRKSFINMSKYIKITASSNLGNILAIVVSSIFLPFFPMTSIQILLLNLLYDILCLVLPWDNVDQEMLQNPLEWSGNTLSRFMLYFGPISSFFDILTFIFLYFYFCPSLAGGSFSSLDIIGQEYFISLFQTAWFLESMWTQILILYLLRTKGLLFKKSKPATPFIIITLLGIIIFSTLVMSPLGSMIKLVKLPLSSFYYLIILVALYLILVTLIKRKYIKKYQDLI